jgi:hypothetical protein
MKRNFKRIRITSYLLLFLAFSNVSFSQLPLITDNTGTLGKEKGQLEISNGIGFQNEHRCVENSTEIAPAFTFGIIDKADLIVGFPFLFSSIQEDTFTSKVAGFSDLSIEMKYCFYKKRGISFALKPGISIPTGKYSLGLGSGKVSSSVFLISSIDLSPFIINCNIGYMRNANKCGDALDVWHVSVDADYTASKEFHIVVNSGLEKNPDFSDKTNPAFGLIGLYYCLSKNCEISAGYKHGITRTEADHAFIYGLTLRF